MKKFELRFLSRTGKKPMICKKINKIKSSQKNIHNQKLRELKSTHHHSREAYREEIQVGRKGAHVLMGQSK